MNHSWDPSVGTRPVKAFSAGSTGTRSHWVDEEVRARGSASYLAAAQAPRKRKYCMQKVWLKCSQIGRASCRERVCLYV